MDDAAKMGRDDQERRQERVTSAITGALRSFPMIPFFDASVHPVFLLGASAVHDVLLPTATLPTTDALVSRKATSVERSTSEHRERVQRPDETEAPQRNRSSSRAGPLDCEGKHWHRSTMSTSAMPVKANLGARVVREMLLPIWANDSWRRLMRAESTSGAEAVGEISLLEMLSVGQVQDVIDLLRNAVRPLRSYAVEPIPELGFTPSATTSTTVHLRFPAKSAHHLSPPPPLSSMSRLASPSSTDASHSASSPSYEAVSTSLDLVATLLADQDIVVLTTILHSPPPTFHVLPRVTPSPLLITTTLPARTRSHSLSHSNINTNATMISLANPPLAVAKSRPSLPRSLSALSSNSIKTIVAHSPRSSGSPRLEPIALETEGANGSSGTSSSSCSCCSRSLLSRPVKGCAPSSSERLTTLSASEKTVSGSEIRVCSDEGTGEKGYIEACSDITMQKSVERLHLLAVEQRANDAEEAKRNQELFIDLFSHEIRNPLSGVWQNAEVVSGSLEHIADMLEDMRLGNIPDDDGFKEVLHEMEENMEAIESILHCCAHQSRIADDVINVSKLSMNLLTINLVPFELAKKIGDVMRMFEIECAQKQIKLSLNRNKSLKSLKAEWILGDPSRLSQILINFLTNSVKYTSDSKGRREIVVHLDAYLSPPKTKDRAMRIASPELSETVEDEDRVWIVVGVKDTGKGLNQEEMAKLFARFSQANPRSDQYGGSGLGLYISRELVALFKGYIEVESVKGEGSTFRFAIPVHRAIQHVDESALTTFGPGSSLTPLIGRKRPASASATARSAATLLRKTESCESIQTAASNSTSVSPTDVELRPSITSSDSSQSQGSVELFTPPPRKPVHVLVVEDNLINQKVLSRQLKLHSFIVTLASNGREGLDILEAEVLRSPESIPISIVLLDIMMPVMGGEDAIKELREKEKLGTIPRRYPVIAVTGNARQGQVESFRKSGFDDVAIKPYRMTDLLVQMNTLLSIP